MEAPCLIYKKNIFDVTEENNCNSDNNKEKKDK